MVLFAYRMAPVAYIVAVRSVAVLLSVLAGTHLLGEEGGRQRIAPAALILAGIAVIALWG